MPFKVLGFERIILIAACVFVVLLGLYGKLNLYIHPRYIVFTAIMTIVGLALLVFGPAPTSRNHSHGKGSWITLLPLVGLLGVAILLPARSLSSATVSQRSVNNGSLVSATNSKPINLLFSGSSRGLKLSDWSRLLQTRGDPGYYINKPAEISGFAYDPGLGPDIVWLARFVLTCCAVDAQPVGVPVFIEGWRELYEEDQWIAVEGEFALRNVEGVEQLVLIPESVVPIDEPGDPYAN